MNKIEGIIKKININGLVSFLDVDCSGIIIKVLILQVPALFKEGDQSELFVKESEVLLAKPDETVNIKNFISIENTIDGKIIKIKSGEIFTEVTTETSLGKIIVLTESVAFDRLEVAELSSVVLLIKANSIGLGALE